MRRLIFSFNTLVFTCVILLTNSSLANAQIFGNKRIKKLTIENKNLRHRIDSLEQLIDNYMSIIAYRDSINTVLDQEDSSDKANEVIPKIYTQRTTDSLLSLWYIHRKNNLLKGRKDYNMDSVHFSSNVPDTVFIDRLKKINSPITIPYNDKVRNFIILYSEKMPKKMSNMLGLAEYYMPIFNEIFNKYQLPEELRYMAVIESGLNPTALSRAGARGMWQFMYSTAKLYGLKINSYVDERLDPIKSADAAARLLKDVYKVFGDWNLAISSYNCGAGNVKKAMRRAGNNKDFWAIYDYLPRETRGYVPAFVGAMYAFKYYKENGITPIKLHIPVHVDTFEIKRNLHFQQIHDLVGIPMVTLRDLNPQYIRDIIPGNEGTYILRIPYQYSNKFVDEEDSLYDYKANELFTPSILKNLNKPTNSKGGIRKIYKVRKGDNLRRIAIRNKVSVNELKRWNHLKSYRLRVGQRLIIYKKGFTDVQPRPIPFQTNKDSK